MQGSFEKQRGEPETEPGMLARTIDSEWIKEHESDRSKLVRVLPLNAKTPEELEEAKGVLKTGELLFKDLREHYGINMPDASTRIEKGRGGYEEALITVDRVSGIDIDDERKLPPDSAPELDAFYSALANHYGDTLDRGGNFWCDFRNDQLMYGTCIGDDKKRVYMVDIDPEYQVYDPEKKAHGKRLLRLIARIYESIVAAEDKLPPGTRLMKARNAIEDVLEKISENEPGYEHIKAVKARIASAEERAA